MSIPETGCWHRFTGRPSKHCGRPWDTRRRRFAAACGIGSRALFINRLSAVRRSLLLLAAMEITSPEILCYDEDEE